jgi:hypothetical protein
LVSARHAENLQVNLAHMHENIDSEDMQQKVVVPVLPNIPVDFANIPLPTLQHQQTNVPDNFGMGFPLGAQGFNPVM